MSDSQPILSVSSKKKLSRTAWWTRELIALGLWSLGAIKLLVFDIDVALAKIIAPDLVPLLRFRFFAALGLVAISWIILGRRRFRTSVLYVLLYPFVVILWKIPKYIFRNWAVVIAFSPAIYSVVTTFRWSFVYGSFAIISALAITISSNATVLTISMVLIGMYLIRHYYRRFRLAFEPSTVFADTAKWVRKLWEQASDTDFFVNMATHTKHDPGTEDYEKARLQDLLSLYLFNSGLRFIATKAQQVATSRRLDMYFIGAILYTFSVTIIAFSFEYFALARIDPSSFTGETSTRFWGFLGFSFATIMTANLSSVVPATDVAKLLSYTELFFGLLILVILVFVVLTIVRERYREDIDEVIIELNRSSAKIADMIEREYSLTLPEAERRLLEDHAAVIEWFSDLPK